jgi:uncharacterized protein
MKKQLKIFWAILIIGFCICTFILPVGAAPEYPHLTKYVSDFSGVLSPQEITALNDQCARVEADTTVEIAIVIVENTGGQDVITYAAKTGESNGVGKKATDNGVVVLMSFENVGGITVASGRGIESTITDIKAKQLTQKAQAYLNEGKFYGGLSLIVSGIATEINRDKETAPQPTRSATSSIPVIGGLTIIIILISKKEAK